MNRIDEKKRTAEESQNVGRSLDKSRRSFAKAGVIAPVLMTLTSKTALGSVYQCTISGVQSGNVSSHSEDMSVCRAGHTALAWRGNVDTIDVNTQSGTHPNINDWIAARINPFLVNKSWPKNTTNYTYKYYKANSWVNASTPAQIKMCQLIVNNFPKTGVNVDSSGKTTETYSATTFSSVFGSASAATTFFETLFYSPSVDIRGAASVDYLNASLGLIPDVSAEDIKKLYLLGINSANSFYDGSLLVSNSEAAKELLRSLVPL
ncbi:hypothetical protein RO575_13665 [Methylomonas sp. MO1]|uniref:hypothetical protein n=1 Tax=unclassified Methylomonas TaxID=2608980 RepID=UPI0004799101|nr:MULTISPECIES: hypothetical protein [unclassified Methylomonas]MDT4290608.1 hypothetical protein [Methylomonas sp. MO1]